MSLSVLCIPQKDPLASTLVRVAYCIPPLSTGYLSFWDQQLYFPLRTHSSPNLNLYLPTSPPHPTLLQAWPMKLAYHFGLRGWFGYGCGVFPSPGQVQLAGCECRTVGHHLSHHLSLRTCLGRKQQVGEQICEKERDIPRTNLQASI